MPRGVPSKGFRMTKNRIAKATGKATPAMARLAPAVESRFSIDERFGFVEQMVTMLANGHQPSVVITGPGGLGKSHTVLNTLDKLGLRDMSDPETSEIGGTNGAKTFKVIKGYTTAKGLYRTLWENRRGTLVFDDTDCVLKDAVCLGLLKSALDSYSKRIITWAADFKGEDELPNSFEFKGRVVFISNIPSCLMDQAVMTRSMVVDLSMTTAQKVERMRTICGHADFMADATLAQKNEALAVVSRLQDKVKELSLRTLIQAIKIRMNGSKNWRDLCEYALCG